jgi:hypothetical protein
MENTTVSNKVFYNSKAEYDELCNNFKQELPELIKKNRVDDWIYHEYGNLRNEHFGLRHSCPDWDVLQTALLKLTKNQNKEWVDNITDILSCAIRGLAKSISYMHIFDDEEEYEECEECGNEIDISSVSFQEHFRNREICNLMIINVINSILFDDDNSGQMEKIIQFKCEKCNEFCDMIRDYDDNATEMCFDCYENTNNSISSSST